MKRNIEKRILSFALILVIILSNGATTSYALYNGFDDMIQLPINSNIENYLNTLPEYSNPDYNYFCHYVYGPRAYYVTFVDTSQSPNIWLDRNIVYQGWQYMSYNSDISTHWRTYRYNGSFILEEDIIGTRIQSGPTSIPNNNILSLELGGNYSVYKDYTLTSLFYPPSPPFVYLAGSTNLTMSGVKKTINLSANAFLDAGAVVATDISPTENQLTDYHYDSTRKKLGSDYIFFLGHANSDAIFANENDPATIGIVKMDTDITVLIKDIGWEEVKLAVFAGCETAEGYGITDSGIIDPIDAANIAQAAYLSGADCALGWETEINGPSLSLWCRNFNTKLAQGSTVFEAIDYANDGFIYPLGIAGGNVKNVRVYGNGDIRIINP